MQTIFNQTNPPNPAPLDLHVHSVLSVNEKIRLHSRVAGEALRYPTYTDAMGFNRGAGVDLLNDLAEDFKSLNAHQIRRKWRVFLE
jgi:hypothetical protein